MDELTNNLAGLEAEEALSSTNSTTPTMPQTRPARQPIPGPPGLPLLGNLVDLDREVPIITLMQLSETYGPIFSLSLGGGPKRVFINSVELLEEMCDESRFGKIVSGALFELREGVGSGLFTAHTDEKEWGIAHRILMPAFGPLAIREMFDDMHDIASQMVLKWARYGPENRILATDDFTRLTLDTISLCAMGYRFNSFYTSDMHPFVDAMVDFLVESGRRASRPKLASFLMRGTNQKYDADVKLMRDVANGVVKARRENPTQKKDLLNAMINGRDPKTGEGLNDEMICDQMITFLIAGHETTSGLLSFAFCNLLQHSSAYRAAQKEVDKVCGKGPITVDHLPKLKYVTAVLRESLRLNPTAPTFATTLHPHLDEGSCTIGNGKYALEKGQPVVAVLPNIHRDPKVYGEDANAFKPERMLDEEFEKLPAAAWKPFGNGMRSCIGRPFAWQESLLVVALLLQHFNFVPDDPNYKLRLKQTLTIKPKDFYMRAILRDEINATKAMSGSATATEKAKPEAKSAGEDKPIRKPMSIFYGSNTGTCEALAQRLSNSAVVHGFDATIGIMDSANEKLPKDHPVVFITASYEGQPPDNAAHFMEWLRSLSGNEASGASFAVFGCGHRDWQSTYQRIPILVNDLLLARGATRVAERGEADASQGDIFTEFDNWEDGKLWPAMAERFGGKPASDETAASTISVEISSKKRSSNLRMDMSEARVTAARCLTAPGEPEKRHMEIQLPSDMPYRAGDYLAVLPVNPRETINRVMKRFQLPWDVHLHISSTAPTVLPTESDISAYDILATYVELSQPATKKNVLAFAAAATDQPEIKASLEALAGDAFREEITAKRTSPLDLLGRYPTLRFPLGDFLGMLPPMRVRQYSISSSPLENPEKCTLTYSVLEGTALSSIPDSTPHRHIGVATAYLSSLEPGNILQVSVRASAKSFHLPLNVETTPIVMACAGSGVAPFRGFVQERATQLAAGRKLAPALLFIGCRYHDKDRLYAEEFEAWEKAGAVEVHYAFSREPEKSEGCRYVQDSMRKEKEALIKTWEKGAKIFVCGGAKVGEAVAQVCKEVYRGRMQQKGEEVSAEQAEEWFGSLRNERFATDVFD